MEILDAKILMVDDERTHIAMLERALTKEGYSNLRSTTDPREVHDIFLEFRPDLILLDIMMPHLDGFKVMEQLNQLVESKTVGPDSINVMVLTARTDPETCFLAYNAGAMDFLEKPFSRQTIVLRVKNILETLFKDRELTRLRNENKSLRDTVEKLTAEIKNLKK